VRANDRGNPYGVPSGLVMLTVTYGALFNTSNAKAASISLLAFLITFTLYIWLLSYEKSQTYKHV
jgi:hypothetical protein